MQSKTVVALLIGSALMTVFLSALVAAGVYLAGPDNIIQAVSETAGQMFELTGDYLESAGRMVWSG